MPTLGFLKKKKKEKDSLHARQNSSNSAEIRNHSEPPTPTTSTSAATSHSHQPSSSTTHSAASTAPSTKPATPTVSEPMALVSERPMIPEQQQQSQQQSYQPPGPSNHQQHQSDINNLINPPASTEYGRSFEPIPGNGPQPHHSHGTPTQAKPEPQHQQARSTKGKYTLSDFILQRTLGTGSFGRVHLVQSRHNMRFYAIKVLKKAQVVKMKQVEHTNDERKMLQKVKHPFLITLWGTFQDNKNLYMVMDFIEGGELFSLLRKSQVSISLSVASKNVDAHAVAAISKSRRKVLRRRSCASARIPPFTQHHLPRSEAGEPALGSSWPSENNGFWVREGSGGHHLDLVWYS
jgi:protein kinase A